MAGLGIFLHGGHAGSGIEDTLALVLLVVVVLGVLLALRPYRRRGHGADHDEPL